MNREHTYSKGSWELVTQQIKEHFGINCLTHELAKTILALYIRGVGVEEIINVLEEMRNEENY